MSQRWPTGHLLLTSVPSDDSEQRERPLIRVMKGPLHGESMTTKRRHFTLYENNNLSCGQSNRLTEQEV